MTSPSLPTDLPVLTDIIHPDGSTLTIPTLTEIVPAAGLTKPLAAEPEAPFAPAADSTEAPTDLLWDVPAQPAETSPSVVVEKNITEQEMRLLLDHFTAHLESVFTEKLDRHLQLLHHQAVKLAILELKEELPELLRKVLHPSNSEK
jgi:hypothetical protein